MTPFSTCKSLLSLCSVSVDVLNPPHEIVVLRPLIPFQSFYSNVLDLLKKTLVYHFDMHLPIKIVYSFFEICYFVNRICTFELCVMKM